MVVRLRLLEVAVAQQGPLLCVTFAAVTLNEKQWMDAFTFLVCCLQAIPKRRSGWACIGNANVAQETIEGTHAREPQAHNRTPPTLHEI